MENTNQKGETLQTTDSVGVTETQKFRILLHRYPDEFEVEASSEEEAKNIARRKVNYAPWEIDVEEAN